MGSGCKRGGGGGGGGGRSGGHRTRIYIEFKYTVQSCPSVQNVFGVHI